MHEVFHMLEVDYVINDENTIYFCLFDSIRIYLSIKDKRITILTSQVFEGLGLFPSRRFNPKETKQLPTLNVSLLSMLSTLYPDKLSICSYILNTINIFLSTLILPCLLLSR